MANKRAPQSIEIDGVELNGIIPKRIVFPFQYVGIKTYYKFQFKQNGRIIPLSFCGESTIKELKRQVVDGVEYSTLALAKMVVVTEGGIIVMPTADAERMLTEFADWKESQNG